MTAQTVARALEKRDTGLDKLMWSKAKHLESILPEHVDVKAFLGTAWAALLANDPLMQNAVNKPDTLLIALFRCAAKGHQPGTEEYYLTPRDGGVLGIEGYRGIIERMYRSGAVSKVVVREVCVKDYFRFVEGEDDKPVHDFAARRGGTTGADFFGQDGNPNRGDMVGVYAVAKFMTGDWSRPVLLGNATTCSRPARLAGGSRRQVQPVEPRRRGPGPPGVHGPVHVAEGPGAGHAYCDPGRMDHYGRPPAGRYGVRPGRPAVPRDRRLGDQAPAVLPGRVHQRGADRLRRRAPVGRAGGQAGR